MISRALHRQLEEQGLLPLLAEREAGAVPSTADWGERLATTDILLLGAAADLARRRECGDEVPIHVGMAPAPSPSVVVIGSDRSERGTALLRAIAIQRLTGPIGLSIVIDFGALGLEIAQVGLNFGATDLAGPIASRRGLPLIEQDDKKLLKRREIAGMIERAGYRPVFASPARTHVDS